MRLFLGKQSVLVDDYVEVLYKNGEIAIYHARAIKEIHLDPDKVEKVGIYKQINEDTEAWAPIPIRY